MKVDTEGIACCFDGRTSRMLDDYRKKGLDKTAEALVDYLASRARGLESLELGSGVGGLTLELARRGARPARGMDLSHEMVRAASALASESGLGGSVSFAIGDGATSKLDSADIVVLDAVLCCYPDVAALVDNTAAAARKFYAFSLPDDRRPMTRLLRPLLPLQRLFLRGTSFRFFLHPVPDVLAQVASRGFTRVFEKKVGLTWLVVVFESSKV